MTKTAAPKKRKKELIYEQAAQLFQEKGYKAASMRELANRVGLKVSSLYSHIGSKEELLQKICFDSADLFNKGILEIETLDGTTFDKIEAIITLHVRIVNSNPSSITVFNDEWKHLTTDLNKPQNLTQFLKLRKNYENKVRRIIMFGIQQQELISIHPEIALQTILSVINCMYYSNKALKDLPVAVLIDQISTILLQGMSFVTNK